MSSESRKPLIFDLCMVGLLGIVFLFLGLGSPGFWEPWESGLVQMADYMSANTADPTIFWVPQTQNHLVHKPLGMVWALMFVQGTSLPANEFTMRLPGASLALFTMLMCFLTMRKYVSRRAAYGGAIALCSLPIFVFGARLLAGGIWFISAVSLPILLYLLCNAAANRAERIVYGTLFGLSWLLAFLGGGLIAIAISLSSLVFFFAWRHRLSTLKFARNIAFLVSFAFSIGMGLFVFSQYMSYVAYALEDHLIVDAERLRADVLADKVNLIGLRHGRVVGFYTDEAAQEYAAEGFVLDVQGTAFGTPRWQTWLVKPFGMVQLYKALEEKQKLVDGELPPFDEVPSSEGAQKAALQFFMYNLYNPDLLAADERATVRSIVAAYPYLGIVHSEPETFDDFLTNLSQRLTPVEQPAGAAVHNDATPDLQGINPEKHPHEVATFTNGQEITIIGPAQDAPGWTEVEYATGKTGFVSTNVLEPKERLAHSTFDSWVRNLGYGLFPWSIFLPFALGVLFIRRAITNPQGGIEEKAAEERATELGGLMMIWFAISVGALGLGFNIFNERAFSGVIPVAVGAGIMLASTHFWERVEEAPIIRKLIGLAAVCVLIFLLSDFYKNPWLLIESYLFEPDMEWDENLRVLEEPYRTFRLAFFGSMVLYFFGALGFGNRLAARLMGFFRWRFSSTLEWLKGRVRSDMYLVRGASGAYTSKVGVHISELSPLSAALSLIYTLARHGIVALWLFLQLFRSMRPLLIVMVLAFSVLTTFVYLPAMSYHLTQKGLLERYEELREGEERLYNVQTQTFKRCTSFADCENGNACVANTCKPEATSYYLGGIDNINKNDLHTLFQGDERVFAIIPRKMLGETNSAFRKNFDPGEVLVEDLDPGVDDASLLASFVSYGEVREATVVKDPATMQSLGYGYVIFANWEDAERLLAQRDDTGFNLSRRRKNLAILDTRSSRYLLASNILRGDEANENYVGDLILDSAPSPVHQIQPPVRFQNGLVFIGYDLNTENISSGQELVITYYFKVNENITQDWQMFLHIDYPGNRINGDHYPGDGEFHTNNWLAGDYVIDVQKIEIDQGSSAGIYKMWFGFFSSGDNRLKVTEGEADGQDRVYLGELNVK